ncbi:MAG: hypothetical protein JMDDDDMK_04686 [Acidobacteria bacterium]|nr:hypothetical protein [Acidobacteriota bacterium]
MTTAAEIKTAVASGIFRITPNVEPMATSNSALQKTSPIIAGKNSTAAQCLPNRASNGSTSVVNSNRRIRPAKINPPRIRLTPKQRPP